MKKLIVLALVLGLVSTASAVVYDLDLSTAGAWLTAGVPNGSEPAGFTFNNDWTINGGYAEVKAFQDLGGGVWDNALELGGTDNGNPTFYMDPAALGIDLQDQVVTYSVRYKLMGALDSGPRFFAGIAGIGGAYSQLGYYDKKWGNSVSDIVMYQSNTDVRFLSDDGVTYTAVSGTEAVVGAQNPLGSWNEMSVKLDGPAGEITFTVNGFSYAYDDFRDVFGTGSLVNLADPVAFPRSIPQLTANGIMQISALSIETVPEPATIALLGMGALALIRKRR